MRGGFLGKLVTSQQAGVEHVLGPPAKLALAGFSSQAGELKPPAEHFLLSGLLGEWL